MMLKGLHAIRAIIKGAGPADQVEARRLAVRATSGIRNPATAAALQEHFLEAISPPLAGAGSKSDSKQERRRKALALLDEIEVASRRGSVAR